MVTDVWEERAAYRSDSNWLTHSLTPWSRAFPEKLTFSATQEISFILCNPKVHCRVHNSPPPVPILSQINPVYALHPTSRRSTLILYFHLRLDLPSGLVSTGFTTKTLHTPLLSTIRASCPAHPSPRDLITRMIFDEYTAQSSLLCSRLHSPVTSSLLGPNILLITLLSKTFPPQCQGPSFTTIQKQAAK